MKQQFPRARGSLRRLLCPLVLLATFLFVAACGPNYADQVKMIRTMVDQGDLSSALGEANVALGVDRSEQMPTGEVGPLTSLLLLERATLLQANGQYKLSMRDFQAADQEMEILDLEQSSGDDIAKYLFSDAMGDYQTAPYEKLLINTMNLLNYLAVGDLSGARIEARRVNILAKYFKETTEDPDVVLGFASYLAGFTFERSGKTGDALRWYSSATQYGKFPSANRAIGYLMKERNLSDDHLQKIAAENTQATKPDADEGEILIVIQAGVAPRRIAKRIPIGMAIAVAAHDRSWNRADRRRADKLAVEGIFKWINFPELQGGQGSSQRFKIKLSSASSSSKLASSASNSTSPKLTYALNVNAQAIQYFKRVQPKLMIAAITRLITRSIAAAATEAAVSSGKKSNTKNILGFLAGKVVEGSMTAADTPDTRSWNTLPHNFWLSRTRLPAGKHHLQISNKKGEVLLEQEIVVRPGGWSLIMLRTL